MIAKSRNFISVFPIIIHYNNFVKQKERKKKEMYVCTDCKKRFFDPKIIFERHGELPPPYERRLLCPYCESDEIAEIEVKHCKCCGARLKSTAVGDYCSGLCKRRGEELRRLEAKRKKERYESPIYTAVRALMLYNKEHGTNLSYGQFVSRMRGK